MHNTQNLLPNTPHKTPLEEQLIARIQKHGPISLEEFMTTCLQDPVHGYYTQNPAPVGKSGDFITAPEISQLFGECLALWCIEQWQILGQPSKICLVELGAGRGTLLKDLLRAAKVLPPFYQALSITIIDSSIPLKSLQKETLAPYQHNISWESRLENLNIDAPILIIGNEFLDVFPIIQHQKKNNKWMDVLVSLNDKCNLCPHLSPIKTNPRITNYSDRDFIEYSPQAEKITKTIDQLLKKHTGSAILIDYGYDTPHGNGNTLQALYKHQKISPFSHCGEADLTAHVDFPCIQNCFSGTTNTITQHIFLKKYGIDLRLAQLLKKASPEQQETLKTGYHRLVSAAEMGTLFKVLTCMHT